MAAFSFIVIVQCRFFKPIFPSYFMTRQVTSTTPFSTFLRQCHMDLKRIDKTVRYEQLAADIGVNSGTLSAWERGEVLPTVDRLEKIAEVFRANIEFLREVYFQTLEIQVQPFRELLQQPEDTVTFGQYIEAHRIVAHRTKEDVAKEIGIHRTVLADWERDRYLPAENRLGNLSRALHADMTELCTRYYAVKIFRDQATNESDASARRPAPVIRKTRPGILKK